MYLPAVSRPILWHVVSTHSVLHCTAPTTWCIFSDRSIVPLMEPDALQDFAAPLMPNIARLQPATGAAQQKTVRHQQQDTVL
jgi:hypothetical protein